MKKETKKLRERGKGKKESIQRTEIDTVGLPHVYNTAVITKHFCMCKKGAVTVLITVGITHIYSICRYTSNQT
jgi:hypothetical protein